jgi:hypothetical protein
MESTWEGVEEVAGGACHDDHAEKATHNVGSVMLPNGSCSHTGSQALQELCTVTSLTGK